MANSEDPCQTAHSGVVSSGSTLFDQTCMSETLGTLCYLMAGSFCIVSSFLFGGAGRALLGRASRLQYIQRDVSLFLFVCSGLTSLSKIFSDISRRCLVATGSSLLTFFSAALLKYHTPDT